MQIEIFLLLIVLGTLLIDFPLISAPCCILSMFFIMKMLQFIRYKSIKNIVKELAKDLSFKGIYDKEKVVDMLDDFKVKYGEDIVEYEELVKMLDQYETFVIKIEYALKNICIQQERNRYNKKSFFEKDKGTSFFNKENKVNCEDFNGNKYKGKILTTYYKDLNERLSVLYKNENGEIKRVNKAIEFFDDRGDESYNVENAVVLRHINKDNKKLTVYLYKKVFSSAEKCIVIPN